MTGYIGTASLAGWSHVHSGKVRDLYVPSDPSWHAGAESLLMVSSDRISVYDRVLPSTIPGKGAILTQLSVWWQRQLGHIVGTQLLDLPVPEEVAGRAVVVRLLQMYGVECFVAGYLTNSMCAEYQSTGAVNGVKLPKGLKEGDELPEPVFLPSFKGLSGTRDVDVTFDDVAHRYGAEVARLLRRTSIEIYTYAARVCERAGIILAANKLEFGYPADAGDETIVLADEVLTPDCSTFWAADDFVTGAKQTSLGKEFVRKSLNDAGWSPSSPHMPPRLSEEIISATLNRYERVSRALQGGAH